MRPLRRSWATFAAAIVAAGCAHQTTRPWLRAESAHVTVYSDEGEAVVRASVAKLEGFYAFLSWATNGGPAREGEFAPRLDVYIVADREELRAIGPTNDEAYGHYYAGPFDTFAMAISEKHGIADELPQLYALLRSYAQHFRAFAPTWMTEAWAGYYGEAAVEARNDRATIFDLGPRYSTLYEQSWIPLPVLLGRGSVDETDAALFHAESWLLLRYLRSEPALRKQLASYLEAVGQGADPEQSLVAATGRDTHQLERALARYLDQNLVKNTASDGLNQIHEQDSEAIGVFLRQRSRPAPPMTIARLPESARDLLLPIQRMKAGIPKVEQAAFLATVRELAARWPGDRLAEVAQGRAETLYGDRVVARKLLDHVLASHKNDVEALELRALTDILDGAKDENRRNILYAQARPYLRRAFQIDPQRYQTQLFYAMSASMDLDDSTDETMKALLRAHELAPQVGAITLAAAQALIQRNDAAQAARILAPLANDPRGGAETAKARALRDQLAGR